MTDRWLRSPGRPGSILVADDDEAIRNTWASILQARGYEVRAAENGRAAMAVLSREPVDVVLADVHMTPTDGWELLAWVRERFPHLPVILVSGFGDVRSGIAAIRAGAVNYLAKPVTAARLVEVVDEAVGNALSGQPEPRSSSAPPLHEEIFLAGNSPTMRQTRARVTELAHSDASVLLLGELGTGKLVIARTIHQQSRRADAPFLWLTWAERSDRSLEQEIGGRHGALAEAAGGTLFLDAIECIPAPVQPRLLQLLADQVATEPAGPPRVRILAGTGGSLSESMRQDHLLAEFFYRLGATIFLLPPLRARPADIAPLAGRLLREEAVARGGPAARLSARTRARLRRHRWPGNVRELRNVMRRAAETGRDVIRPADVHLPSSHTQDPRLRSLASEEGQHIERVLEEAGGNKSRAAHILGISRATLYRKLRRLRATKGRPFRRRR